MSDQPSVSSDRVMEILQREPLGAALLRAAIAEATAEAWQAKFTELRRPTDKGKANPDRTIAP